jgi:glutamate/tyrosine decarboxylase-like PLP-dependent enzyme
MTAEPDYAPALEQALRHSLNHLGKAKDGPVGAAATLAQLRARLGRPLAEDGMAPAQVIDELVRDVEGGIVNSTCGRFFGWVIGGTLPAAMAADWLTSAWDQNAAIHACGPAEAVIEEVVGEWLKDIFSLPQAASFAFVTGTQMAHLVCLASARHRLLKQAGGMWSSRVFLAPPRSAS